MNPRFLSPPRRALTALLFSLWVGCVPAAGVSDEDAGMPADDLGDRTGNLGAPGEPGGDGVGSGTGDPCGPLVARACEPSCDDSAGCNGARLLAELAPERCEEAAAQLERYPACVPNECQKLVRRVCGAAERGAGDRADDGDPAPCATDPGCQAAQALAALEEGTGPEESAEAERACLQAGEDPDLFVTCEQEAP